MMYSGGTTHFGGVAIVISNRLKSKIIGSVYDSDRIIMIKLNTKPVCTNIIQIYAPTSDRSKQECDIFYNRLENIIGLTDNRDCTVLMGDFNAKVGKGEDKPAIGPYGLGKRNSRGDALAEFCNRHELIVTNTWFEQPVRRLYTWKAPGDTANKIIRNQIDYILISSRYRNAIKNTKTLPGADINSDHTLLSSRMELKFKITQKSNKNNKKVNLEKLCDVNQVDVFQNSLEKYDQNTCMKSNLNDKLECLITKIKSAAEEVLVDKSIEKKKEWMTEEILMLMMERKSLKNNATQYKLKDKQIKNEIKKAKQAWLDEKCHNIEMYGKLNNPHKLHNEIKSMCGISRTHVKGNLKNKDGKILTENMEIVNKWQEYIEGTFKDESRGALLLENTTNSPGLSILLEEVEKAVEELAMRKVCGEDEVFAEHLKCLDSNSTRELRNLMQ